MMKINKSKYKLEQNGKEYQLSTQIYQNKIRIACIQLENNNQYIGDFPLIDLRKKDQIFNSIQNINDALKVINKIIDSKMVSVEPYDRYINFKLYIMDEDGNSILKPNTGKNSPSFKKGSIIKYPKQQKQSRTINLILNQLKNPISSSSQQEKFSFAGSLYDKYQDQNDYNKLMIGNVRQMNYNNNKLIELIYENGRLKKENELLRNEINKSRTELEQFNNQIQVLNHEKNDIIKHNMIIREDENRDKLKTKSEIEKLRNELFNLKNQYNSKLEEYKKIKENEINILNSRINELLNNQRNMENLIKENAELKLRMKYLSVINKNNSIILNQKSTQIFDLENRMKTMIDQNETIYKANLIKNKDELDFLIKKICIDNHRININLIYKATVDSDKAEAFHDKCDNANSSIVIIEIENGRRFGGFTKCSWEGNNIEKNDNYAFIFSLDEFNIYDVIQGEAAIGCYRDYGPIFTGYQIKIYDDAFTKGGETALKGANYKTNEDYELSGGLEKYNVKEIEVFEVKFE